MTLIRNKTGKERLTVLALLSLTISVYISNIYARQVLNTMTKRKRKTIILSTRGYIKFDYIVFLT